MAKRQTLKSVFPYMIAKRPETRITQLDTSDLETLFGLADKEPFASLANDMIPLVLRHERYHRLSETARSVVVNMGIKLGLHYRLLRSWGFGLADEQVVRLLDGIVDSCQAATLLEDWMVRYPDQDLSCLLRLVNSAVDASIVLCSQAPLSELEIERLLLLVDSPESVERLLCSCTRNILDVHVQRFVGIVSKSEYSCIVVAKNSSYAWAKELIYKVKSSSGAKQALRWDTDKLETEAVDYIVSLVDNELDAVSALRCKSLNLAQLIKLAACVESDYELSRLAVFHPMPVEWVEVVAANVTDEDSIARLVLRGQNVSKELREKLFSKLSVDYILTLENKVWPDEWELCNEHGVALVRAVLADNKPQQKRKKSSRAAK